MKCEKYTSSVGAVIRFTLDDGAVRYYIPTPNGNLLALHNQVSMDIIRKPNSAANTIEGFVVLALHCIDWIDQCAKQEEIDADTYELFRTRKTEFYDFLQDVKLSPKPIEITTPSRDSLFRNFS